MAQTKLDHERLQEIYVECRRLRLEFVLQEESKLPSYMFAHEEGDRYISDPDVYDKIMRKADRYYQRCLDECTRRVPK